MSKILGWFKDLSPVGKFLVSAATIVVAVVAILTLLLTHHDGHSDFNISVNPTSGEASPGSTLQTSITIKAVDGYNIDGIPEDSRTIS